MEELQSQGLTKSIGVSNYLPEHLDWIFETCKVPPAVNQIEFHPYLQHEPLIEYHKKKVRLSQRPHPRPKTNLHHQSIATCAYGPLTPVTKGAGGPIDDILNSLAKKYAVNPGEILLRWCIDQDIVPITTSSKEQRLSDYLRAMTFKLNPAEIKQVSQACVLRKRICADVPFRSTRREVRSTCVDSGRTSMMRMTRDERLMNLRLEASSGDATDLQIEGSKGYQNVSVATVNGTYFTTSIRIQKNCSFPRC